jgi:uncharacterized membrane protein YhhN
MTMNKNSWIILFIGALAAHLAGILISHQALQFISKPLIVIALIGYFLSATKKTAFTKWVLLALFFSLAGDVLLLFQVKDDIFFLLGLSAFLLAHIFYILFFHRVRVNEAIEGRWWLLLIVVIYYAVLISFLSGYLGDMKLPVRVYGVVISFMLMLALHMGFLENKKAGRLMMAGALLFVVSDSVLAINKFYLSFEAAGVIIMLTYALAQLFIVRGAVAYLASVHKE